MIKILQSIKRELRREFLIHFRPDYIKKQMEKKRGVCGRHGCCLVSPFGKRRLGKCLDKDGKTCLLWHNLPKRCQLYPIDEKDKDPATKDYCNFYWDN